MLHSQLGCVLLFPALNVMMVTANGPYSTLHYDISTMGTNVTLDDMDCLCDCDALEEAANRSASAPANQAQAEQAASQLTADLKVDTSNLSSTTRRKTSAPDDRPSATGIGVVGVIVIVAVICSIVALDAATIFRDIKTAARRLMVSDIPEGGYKKRKTPGGGTLAVNASHVYTPFREVAAEPGVQLEEKEENETDRHNGDVGDKELDQAPVISSGVRDIKSRRELLLMHGEQQ